MTTRTNRSQSDGAAVRPALASQQWMTVPVNGLLGRQVLAANGSTPRSGRRLNPLFVEWLMGWPLGWTDFAPLGTGWSRWQRAMRSERSRVSS